jgi:hypothetical protein
MDPAIFPVIFTVGLSLAIALGIVAASHGVLRLASSGEGPKPRFLVAAGPWIIAVVVVHGYSIWDAQTQRARYQRYQEMAAGLNAEAKQIAESKGEDVAPKRGGLPTGPIFEAELAKHPERYFEPYPTWIYRLFALLWLACCLTVGGYYCAAFRRSWGWPKTLAVSSFFAFVQLFVVAVTTFCLQIMTHHVMGGMK